MPVLLICIVKSLCVLFDHAAANAKTTVTWNSALQWDLEFIAHALQQPHSRTYQLSVCPRNKAILYSDASFELSGLGPKSRLCGMIIMGKLKEGFVMDLSPSIFDNFSERSAQIAAAEMLVFLMIIKIYGSILAESSAMAFIDNVGVIYNLVNGNSRFQDLGSLSFGVQVGIIKHGINVWVEHVASWSNSQMVEAEKAS